MKTFLHNNSNADVLVIPQEEGGTEDDKYFGSIGDATMKHIQNLDHGQRQIWEELIHMRSGAIFRIVPSFDQHDTDPLNLHGKDLEKQIKKLKTPRNYIDAITGQPGVTRGLTDEEIKPFLEAFEQEEERRETSEDALDKGNLIPYSEWEKLPQQWQHIEMPTTPRDRFIYMGNTNQAFYDSFPEGHQDAHLINQVISLLNKDWKEDISHKYGEWIKDNIIYPSQIKGYTSKYLVSLVDKLVEGNDDPDDLVKRTLANIDRCWGIEFKNEVASKAAHDPILQVILSNEKDWEQQAKEGINVYASVKLFGQALFQDKELRSQTNGYHWARYRRIKAHHAPRVICRGYDINRCHPRELMTALNIERNQADKIWFNRPFENLGILYHKGYINTSTFSDNDTTDKIILLLEKRAKISQESRDIKKFSVARHLLMRWQRDKKFDLKPSQWRMIWQCYRLLNEDVLEAINGGEKEGEQDVRTR